MAVRRCVECGRVNRPTAPVCDCGYTFDRAKAATLGLASGAVDMASEPIEAQRHYYTHRLTMGWFTLIGATIGLLVSTVFLVFAFVFFVFAMSAFGGLMVKGIAMIRSGRRGLAALGDIPTARLLKG